MAQVQRTFPTSMWGSGALIVTYDDQTLVVSTVGLLNNAKIPVGFALTYQGVVLQDASSPPNYTRVLPAMSVVNFDVSKFGVTLGQVTGPLPPGWGYYVSSLG